MQRSKQTQTVWKKIPFAIIGIIAVVAVMLLLLWDNTTSSNQSIPVSFPKAYFEGTYQIGDGAPKTIENGQHISATQGDVTLKGQFHLISPKGDYIGLATSGSTIVFYVNHIHITVQEPDLPAHVIDVESDFAGKGLCGELCVGYNLKTDGPITLTFHNYHRFGNENAIDDFLRELSLYAGTAFEKQFMRQGNAERNAGSVSVIVAIALLGTALLSSLLHIEGSSKLWLIGLCVFFAGGYFIYGATGVSFWSDSIIQNTSTLGICMMLYMLCLSALITSVFSKKWRKIGIAAVVFLGAACVTIAILCLVTNIRFYDTWLWWAILQSVVNAVLLLCLVFSFSGASKGKITGCISSIILLIGFEADFAGTALGWWQGGLLSKHIFLLLLVLSIVLVWQVIPRNINAARRAKETEAEQKAIRAQLQENRIAIMISQIQPHFIYNTLGTIQQLCKEDPEHAATLIRDFSMYLRGNFSELDNTAPIRFSKELEHVRCYTDIELVRFPDMTVHYDIQTEDFLLPALTVQPLVENAIKHGLMGLEEGGTVTVATFETPTHYCVKVTDDGVGFDTACPPDEQKHVGIRNVRERLQVLCDGSLTVDSQKGKGTVALIQIPKEGKK